MIFLEYIKLFDGAVKSNLYRIGKEKINHAAIYIIIMKSRLTDYDAMNVIMVTRK